MRKAVPILGILALAFAASTVYLALKLARTREQLASARAVHVTPAATARAEVPRTMPAAADPPAEAARPADAPQDLKAEARAWTVRMIPEWRQLLEDPSRRERFLREAQDNFHLMFPKIAKDLALTDDESSRLADLLAAQQLRMI